MTRVELLRRITDDDEFIDTLFRVLEEYSSFNDFSKMMKKDVDENVLRKIISHVARNKNYPLSLDGLQ